VTLWIASLRFFGVFSPKYVSFFQMAPIAAAMAIQVVLQNLSLAHSSVMFHQLARLLLTPNVALLNYVLYRVKIPRAAIIPLILLCSGVAVVTYYDSLPKADNGSTTSTLGVIFALTAVCASSIYTVWIGFYHKRFELSSMQLLLNQAPISAGILLCSIPFAETAPSISTVPSGIWSLVLMVSTDRPMSSRLADANNNSRVEFLHVL
jgi:solute carrier family 35 protein E3